MRPWPRLFRAMEYLSLRQPAPGGFRAACAWLERLPTPRPLSGMARAGMGLGPPSRPPSPHRLSPGALPPPQLTRRLQTQSQSPSASREEDAASDARRLARVWSRVLKSPGAPPSPAHVLLGQSRESLRGLVQSLGHPAYRGAQLWTCLEQGAARVEDMAVLPVSLREALVQRGYVTGRSRVVIARRAPDGATKLLLELLDGQRIECVSIPSRARLTACVSSQVGCAMACVFCATGRAGLARSLLPFEILDQVLHVRWLEGGDGGAEDGREAGRQKLPLTSVRGRITHLVFMGQGEPAAALPSVLPALRHICGPWGLSMRGVTLSTVGVRGALARLARENLALTLAVSLHAPSQALRAALVPSARAYPLGELLEDCAAYFRHTGRRVSFEYVLLGGRNDQEAHAEQLVALLGRYRGRMRAHVNLIPWNAVEGAAFEASSEKVVQAFAAVLDKARIPVTVRRSKGRGAQAACGQLKNAGKAPVKDLLEG